jgi:predicted NACHT family NTPase
VLRDLTGSFREGGKGLAHYLAQVCQDPYNLEPPPHAIEYLLRNGRAIVLLDGLDELVEPALRRKVVQLADGFVNLYPLVPVLVTARRVGYHDAALDRGSFTVGRVAELNDDQVEQYATRWFDLDEGIAEAKRAQMALSFVAESHNIAELRRNPLLLALLCAMYSNEHYIPANLAQVYERCAVMVFDQWDFQRGLADAPQFHGRLRTAVQPLAWQLATAEELFGTPRQEVPRQVRPLGERRLDCDAAQSSPPARPPREPASRRTIAVRWA